MNPEKNNGIQNRKRKRFKNKSEPTTKDVMKNRITMKMGLYSNGKKSDTVTRVVSEEVKARANEDLKRILQLANSPENKRRKNNVVLDRPSSSSVDDNFDENECVNDNSREDELDATFPTSPPISSVAERLSSVLDAKINYLFPGVDYLQERKNDLRKFLAKNNDVPLLLSQCNSSPSPGESNESYFRLNIPNQEPTQSVNYSEQSPVPQVQITDNNKWPADSSLSKENFSSHQRDKTCSSPVTNMDMLDYLERVEIEDDGDDGVEYESDVTPPWNNFFQSSARKPAVVSSPSPPQTFYRRRLY